MINLDTTPSKPEKKDKEKASSSPDQADSPSESMEAKDSQSTEGRKLMRQDSAASITNDPVRIKCRELIASSLQLDEDSESFMLFMIPWLVISNIYMYIEYIKIISFLKFLRSSYENIFLKVFLFIL